MQLTNYRRVVVHRLAVLALCCFQWVAHGWTQAPISPSYLTSSFAGGGISWYEPASTQNTGTTTTRSTGISGTSTIITTMGLRGKKLRRLKREARKEKTPPRIDTPYGPIRIVRPPTVCDACQGRGMVRCSVCEGRGVVRATGLQKRNSLPKKLVSSQWTSVEVYRGHRHHTIMEVCGSSRNPDTHQVRMRNCCGETSDFWIPVQELKEKRIWRMGWLTLEDILRADGGPLIDARLCFRCKGARILPCVDCDGKGSIPSYEPLYE